MSGSLLFILCAAAVAQEELDLLAASLRPAGRAELEANVAPLPQLPVAEVQAELDAKTARIEGRLRLTVRNREPLAWSELVLRTYPNAERGSSLRVEGVEVDGKRVAARSRGSVVDVPVALEPGRSAVVSLFFAGSCDGSARATTIRSPPPSRC